MQLRLGEMAQMMGMSKDCADDYLTITGQPYDPTGVTSVKDELENRDPRLLQTIATPYAGPYTYYLEGKRSSISSFLEGGTHSSTGYAIAKFYNEKEFSDTHGVGTLDAIIFRYAEVLLIRAEAGAELGKDPELDLTVNALRKRVGFNVKLTSSPATDPKLVAKHPIIKGTNADLIREIRRERRVELFGEGLRYADLMRWGCGERLVAPKAGMMLYTDVYTPEEIAVLKTEVGTYADGSLDVYGKRVTTPAILPSTMRKSLAVVPLKRKSNSLLYSFTVPEYTVRNCPPPLDSCISKSVSSPFSREKAMDTPSILAPFCKVKVM